MYAHCLLSEQGLPIFANKEVVVPNTSRPVMLNPVLSPDIGQFVMTYQLWVFAGWQVAKVEAPKLCWQAFGELGRPRNVQS